MIKKKSPRKLVAKKSKAVNRRKKPAKVAPGVLAKAHLQYVPWHTIPLEQLNPLLQRQFVTGQEVMLARILLKKGSIVPQHSHHNEQFSYVLDGAVKFWIDGKEIIVRSGEVLGIPGHMPHKVEALEDSVSLDVFSPPRADWINRDDQYLRGGK
jgi:quercetin dioxygenase-like cupin family protein